MSAKLVSNPDPDWAGPLEGIESVVEEFVGSVSGNCGYLKRTVILVSDILHNEALLVDASKPLFLSIDHNSEVAAAEAGSSPT
jgi:hypothetical protein